MYLDKINMVLDTHAPFKKIDKYKIKFKSKPQIALGLQKSTSVKNKQAYYEKYFEKNWNNIKKTWKGIKSLISLNTVASNVPTVLSLDNDDTVISLYDIANTFDNYFVSIAKTNKASDPNGIPYRI